MRPQSLLVLGMVAFTAALLQGCTSGAAGKDVQDVWVGLNEWRLETGTRTFSPEVTYRLRVVNMGKIPHQLMLVPRGERDAAKAVMFISQDELLPGITAVREVRFIGEGEFELACHVEWHYEAGMKRAISVR